MGSRRGVGKCDGQAARRARHAPRLKPHLQHGGAQARPAAARGMQTSTTAARPPGVHKDSSPRVGHMLGEAQLVLTSTTAVRLPSVYCAASCRWCLWAAISCTSRCAHTADTKRHNAT